jgi:excisionase family DNA binding protein
MKKQQRQQKQNANPILMRPDEVAPLLNIELSTVWAWLRRGVLPHVRIGTRYFISRASLMRWIEEQEKWGE